MFSLELLKWGTATVCTSVSDMPSAWQLVHMDLKPANILLQDKNCLVAKIADLGLSSYLAEGSLLTNHGRGASSLYSGHCSP